jgi:hypothetical protein
MSQDLQHSQLMTIHRVGGEDRQVVEDVLKGIDQILS